MSMLKRGDQSNKLKRNEAEVDAIVANLGPNRTDHIQIIRAACIKANPEIARERVCDCSFCQDEKGLGQHLIVGRPIRLADVLYAVGEKDDDGLGLLTVTGGGLMQYSENVTVKHSPLRAFYDLSKDDLEQQSDETVAFISSLLTV